MIYILRHGQTELNSAGRLQGRSDHPLNDRGREEARRAAEQLSGREITFDHVFSSPLRRALQTAEIVAPYAEAVIEPRLIEMDYGPYEGIGMDNLPEEVKVFFSDFVNNPAPEGMEQLADVVARTGAFLEEIKGLAGNILLSTHAIAMKGALEYLTPGSNGSFWSKFLGNCAVYAVPNKGGVLGIPEEVR